MTRQNEWLAEHGLSGGGAVVFPGHCAESQEDPWEVVDPVRRGAEGVEGILQAEVEGCYHPVGLQVVGSSLVVLDVEQAAEGGAQGGGELGPAVRCYDCRDSTAHPSLKQSIHEVYCRGGGNRYGFRLAGRFVIDSEKTVKIFGCRQGAYQVHVDVAETAGGYWDVLQGYLYMAVDLGLLAARAVTSVERPFQTYLEEMRRRVARRQGWAVPWRCWKT